MLSKKTVLVGLSRKQTFFQRIGVDWGEKPYEQHPFVDSATMDTLKWTAFEVETSKISKDEYIYIYI